jgi:ADP-ribose pyrophosphatase YjhB (NUDIX family)
METRSCQVHKLVADTCLIAGGRVLLVRYKDTSRYDGQEGWFLPDDFLWHLEHPEDAARRILLEQVHVSPPQLTLSHIESFDGDAWHLIFHYRAQLAEIPTLDPGENLRDAEWFALEALPAASDVAHHGWALDVIRKTVEG